MSKLSVEGEAGTTESSMRQIRALSLRDAQSHCNSKLSEADASMCGGRAVTARLIRPPMPRLPNWRSRLSAYLAAARTKPFVYGEHDCARFAAGAVEAVTGVDPSADLGIRYTTLAGGRRALRARGYRDPVAFVRERFEEIAVSFARAGDLAVLDTAAGPALAVVGGAEVFAPAPERGLVVLPLTTAITAFRV